MGGLGRLAGSCTGSGGRLAACSAADPLHLRSRHVESRPRSKPAQYIRRGDGARHLRRSPRYDLARLPQGEILRETTRHALGAWPPHFLRGWLPKALSVRDGNSSWIINGSRISLAIVVLKCTASLELESRGTCEGLHLGEEPLVSSTRAWGGKCNGILKAKVGRERWKLEAFVNAGYLHDASGERKLSGFLSLLYSAGLSTCHSLIRKRARSPLG
jgi:hypothetical protein